MASADGSAPASVESLPAGVESRPAGVESLPPELLASIFSFLPGPAPSDTRLNDQPSSTMLESASTPLKHASLVCRRWRGVALRLLFRHVIWHLDRWELLLVEPKADHVASIPLLAYLRDADLGRYVQTWTMIVNDSYGGQYSLRMRNGAWSSVYTGSLSDHPGHAQTPTAEGYLPDKATYGENNNWFWDAVFSVVDPLRFTIIASPRMLTSLMSRMLFLGDSWGFQASYHILSMSRTTRRHISTTASPPGTTTPGTPPRGTPPPRTAAPPQTAGTTPPGPPLGTPPRGTPPPGTTPPITTPPVQTATSNPTWPQPEDSSSAPSSSSNPPQVCATRGPRVPCNLFTIRPWTSLLLNEGSSLRIYRTYEFFLKRPPSILGALLGAEEFPNDSPLIPPTVRSLAYVAIFPLSTHFHVLVRHLPPLDRLFVQIVPPPHSGLLHDKDEMRGLDPADLWMERNTCYSLVMHEMLEPGTWVDETTNQTWYALREFETGDAADREAWAMAANYVRQSGGDWRVGGQGLFVRRREDDHAHSDDDEDSESDSGVGGDWGDGEGSSVGPPSANEDLHFDDSDYD